MEKSQLLVSAKKLVQPTQSTANEFIEKRELLCVLVINRLKMDEHFLKSVAEEKIRIAFDNTMNFSNFMESLFVIYLPEVFVETSYWAIKTYRPHGFQPDYWRIHLEIWCSILKTELTDKSYNEIIPFFEWLMENISVFTELTNWENCKLKLEHTLANNSDND